MTYHNWHRIPLGYRFDFLVRKIENDGDDEIEAVKGLCRCSQSLTLTSLKLRCGNFGPRWRSLLRIRLKEMVHSPQDRPAAEASKRSVMEMHGTAAASGLEVVSPGAVMSA